MIVDQMFLISNINIKYLAIHVEHISFEKFWVFRDLLYSSFFSTCGKFKLNFDDDDVPTLFPVVSSNGSIRLLFIFTFLHKVFCIFNFGFFALVDCWVTVAWISNDLNKKKSNKIEYIKSLKFKRLWLKILQIYLPNFLSIKYWELFPIDHLSNVFNV